jgi:hypothetical protein
MAATALAGPDGSAHAQDVTGPLGTVRASLPLAIRSGPGTGYSVTGTARTAPGYYRVLCYADGDVETGWGGTNRHWDQIAPADDPGHGLGYVADVWLDTGGDVTGQAKRCVQAPPTHPKQPLSAVGQRDAPASGDPADDHPDHRNRPVDGDDDYPDAWKAQGQDSFGTAFGLNRECVSFVAWKIYENSGGREVPTANAAPGDYATYSIDVDDDWGDAWAWGGYARANGVSVDDVPTVGSVAWWDRTGVFAAHGTGHVAYVTAVDTSGGAVTGFDIAQYNIEGDDGAYSTMHFTVADGRLVAAANTSRGGPLAGVDLSWVPMPSGFVHINGF